MKILTGEEMVEILILVNAYVRGLAQALVDVARQSETPA